MPVCATATEHEGTHLMTSTHTSGLTKTAPQHVHTQQFASLDIIHFAGHLSITLKIPSPTSIQFSSISKDSDLIVFF